MTPDDTSTQTRSPAPDVTAGRSTFLPFHRPWIESEEIAEVTDTLQSGWLTMGPKTLRFEEEFAAYVGARHAVAVSSATAGLHLAVDACGLGPGDEVITSPYTFTATAAVVLHAGARPVFADIDPQTLTLDPADAARRITPRTRALIPVHMAGLPCAMDDLMALARRHGLAVIEDAAHALPARVGGRMIGTIGDLTVFSFYAGKNITTGEGGMVTTDRGEYAERLRTRRLHGISRDAWKRYTAQGSWYYEVEYPGFKYNMTDINAALGLHQLRKCDRFHALRTRHAARYRAGLADLPELQLPADPGAATGVQHAWHLFVVRLRPGHLRIDRDAFVEALRGRNIGTSVHFIPLHLHPYYRHALGCGPETCPRATAAYRGALSLPLYPRMTDDDVDDVIAAVRDIVKETRR
jgi:dTDP-4-amino-4,6-dideoxygalactose transaminase